MMARKSPYKTSYDKYAIEVFNMTRHYEALNAKQPTITRKPTEEEKQFFMEASRKAIEEKERWKRIYGNL